jgi:hypothetical protein
MKLIYVDDVNLLGGDYSIKKGTETLIDAGKEVGLDVNAEKSKYSYVLLPHRRNAGQNHDIKKANKALKMCQFNI